MRHKLQASLKIESPVFEKPLLTTCFETYQVNKSSEKGDAHHYLMNL